MPRRKRTAVKRHRWEPPDTILPWTLDSPDPDRDLWGDCENEFSFGGGVPLLRRRCHGARHAALGSVHRRAVALRRDRPVWLRSAPHGDCATTMPSMLARGLSTGVVVVGIASVAMAAYLWRADAAAVQEAAAAVAASHEIAPSPPARTPGGLDFRPIPIDMDVEQLQATQRIRIRNGLGRGDRRAPWPGRHPRCQHGRAPARLHDALRRCRSATPTLAEFAKTSTVFTRAYAQANETLFSHASLFTSTIPSHLDELDYDLTHPRRVSRRSPWRSATRATGRRRWSPGAISRASSVSTTDSRSTSRGNGWARSRRPSRSR